MMIKTVEELEAIYGQPAGPSVHKEIDYISAEYRALIEASPFVGLASVAPDVTRCSARGFLDTKPPRCPSRNWLSPESAASPRSPPIRIDSKPRWRPKGAVDWLG